MKKWMIATKGKNHILLHYNEDSLEQYDKLKRVDTKMLNKLIKNAKAKKGEQK